MADFSPAGFNEVALPEDLYGASVLSVGLCLGVLLWGVTIGAVYWDLKRRGLPRREARAWLALAVLLPGVGLVAYLMGRLLGLAFPLPTDTPLAGQPNRVTRLKEAPAAAPRTGTIVAAELVKPTIAQHQPEQALGVRLAAVAGPHVGDEFIVQALPARLGRGGEVALRLDRDLGVSRQHAELYRQDGILRIRDLSSVHGTYVNGFSVRDKALAPGDRIGVGHSTLAVKQVGA